MGNMFGDPVEPVEKRSTPIETIRYQTCNGTWHDGKIRDMKVKGHSRNYMKEKYIKLNQKPPLAFKIKDSATKIYFLLPLEETEASHEMQWLLRQQIVRYCEKEAARAKK